MATSRNALQDENKARTELLRERKLFCDQAISGALNLFSPWSATPGLALEIFKQATSSCEHTLSAAPLGAWAQGSHSSKLAALVAAKGDLLDRDFKLPTAPREQSAAWRSALAEAYLWVTRGMEEKLRLLPCAAGPLWLLEGALDAIQPSASVRWSAAEALASKSPRKTAHAAACLPEGSHLLSRMPGSARCVLSWLGREWEKTKSDYLEKLTQAPNSSAFTPCFPRSMVEESLWRDPGSRKALQASFKAASLDGSAIDAQAALLAQLSCAAAPAPWSDWPLSMPKGRLSAKDAAAGILGAPPELLGWAAKAAASMAAPDALTLQAMLWRLTGAPAAIRGELALACLDQLESLAALDPAAPNASVLNAKGEPLKTKPLGANAFELALRAAISNKASAAPASQESRCVARALERLSELGFDMEAPGAGSAPSAAEKLRSLKSSEAKAWQAWSESIQIRAAVDDAQATAPSARPRL